VGPIDLLIPVALGVAVFTAFQRVARAREEHGPDAPEAAPGNLWALLGVRVGGVLLIVSALALVAGTNEVYSISGGKYAIFTVMAFLVIGFGAVHHRHDRQAAGTTQARSGESMTRCPHCAESLQATANVCRYCGRDVEPSKAEVDDLRAQSG
jgi:uncharacterized protein (DUF983 family)